MFKVLLLSHLGRLQLESAEHVGGGEVEIGELLDKKFAGGVLQTPEAVPRPLEEAQHQIPPGIILLITLIITVIMTDLHD